MHFLIFDEHLRNISYFPGTVLSMRNISEIFIYGYNLKCDLLQTITGELLIYVFQQQYMNIFKKGI